MIILIACGHECAMHLARHIADLALNEKTVIAYETEPVSPVHELPIDLIMPPPIELFVEQQLPSYTTPRTIGSPSRGYPKSPRNPKAQRL